MNIPLGILGAVTIALGVIFIKTSINSYKSKIKDTFGSVIQSLIGGIGLIVIRVIIILKAIAG